MRAQTLTRGTQTQRTKMQRWQGPVVAAAGIVLSSMNVIDPAIAASAKETGLWYDDSGKGAVEIVKCGPALCGRIVWLEDPLNAEGLPKMDKYNPKPANRTNPICGLQVIGNLQALPEGGLDGGWIYDPKQGAAFDLAAQLISKDQLQITGYKGVKLFSKTFVWNRAPADLPRCNTPTEAQGAAPQPQKAQKPKDKAVIDATAAKPAKPKPVEASAAAPVKAKAKPAE